MPKMPKNDELVDSLPEGSVSAIHAGLSGLESDDHPQYLTLDRAANSFSVRGHKHGAEHLVGLDERLATKLDARSVVSADKAVKVEAAGDKVKISLGEISHAALIDKEANDHPQYVLIDTMEKRLVEFLGTALKAKGLVTVSREKDQYVFAVREDLALKSYVADAIKEHDELNDPHKIVARITLALEEVLTRLTALEDTSAYTAILDRLTAVEEKLNGPVKK